ncbi:MAG TPA: hypothetical protein VFE33_16965 [Thermoanaerobaculia bacterium]|nr:hypothetical protein [Thermoanaerobaculia bacterium]
MSAPAAAPGGPSHPLLDLQRTIGNRAVQSGLNGLRTRVSRITGTDVGAVPVEAGDAGGKRASTHQGRVTLGALATERDVAHELAHAAQQRSNTGDWLGAGAAERRADDVAAAALAGTAAPLPAMPAISVGRVPGAAVLGAGDPYSREALTLTAPPAGYKVKDFEDQLKLKITAGDITGYSLSGVKSGDPEEIYLYNALVLLADKRRWGSELDLVTSIGAGKGEVTVRFDAAGKAVAQLVGKAAPAVPAAFTTVKDASDALVKTYKLAKVTGEHGKSWSLDELNKVVAAWGRLSTAEAAALAGYTLLRTDKLTSATGEDLQGQTTHTDDVATGATTATHAREIRFADRTFADDDKSFIGDAKDAAPASFETLIHEVGHALEAKPFDDLNAVAADDSAKANLAGVDAHAKQLAANKAINPALDGKYSKKDMTAGQPLVDQVLAAQKVLQAFEASPDAVHETNAKKAISDRDAAKAAIPAGNSVVAGFAAALTAQDAYFAALEKLFAAKTTADASRAAADKLKTGSNTTRLQVFVDFVTKEAIKPPTAYAAKHWPSEPAEFYDEAFSLWKNDPTFFAKYSPKLKAWFDAGKYLT